MYDGGRYSDPARPAEPDFSNSGARNRRASEYDSQYGDREYKRESYIRDVDMWHIVMRVVSNCVPRRSCYGRDPHTLVLREQYLPSTWHEALSLSILQVAGGDARPIGCSWSHAVENAYRVCWKTYQLSQHTV